MGLALKVLSERRSNAVLTGGAIVHESIRILSKAQKLREPLRSSRLSCLWLRRDKLAVWNRMVPRWSEGLQSATESRGRKGFDIVHQ